MIPLTQPPPEYGRVPAPPATVPQVAKTPAVPVSPAAPREGPIDLGPYVSCNRTDFLRMMDTEAPDYAIVMGQIEVDQAMDAVGWEVILEEIARGNLPNTLALRYRVPIIKFHRWLDSRVPESHLRAEADKLCAQSMVVKSHMVLQQDATDATQASMMRAFSKRISEVAEAVAPEDWIPNKDAGRDVVGTTAIQINIGGSAAIPGTEVLAAPAVTVEHTEDKK